MKKSLLFFLMSLCSPLFMFADGVVRIYENVVAGSLPTLISNVEKHTITDLTITGQLNGTDFRLLREMAGNNFQGQPTNSVLKRLDISGVNIIEGGEYYLEAKEIKSSQEVLISYVETAQFGTQNNVLSSMIFADCESLEEVILPNSITTIERDAFYYCPQLMSLEIPVNVSSIDSNYFGCNGLSEVSVAEGNQTYSSPEGSNAIMLGTKLISGCKNTQIPIGTTIIGSDAFFGCIGLNVVTIPEGVTTIESRAFGLSDLKGINLPTTLVSIGDYAFEHCMELETFILSKSVTEIGKGIFQGCYKLTDLSVDTNNTIYDSRDNCNAIIETSSNKLFCGIETTVIPTSVTSIGDYAFFGIHPSSNDCYRIPNWVTSIGEHAFENSGSYMTIIIPNSVTLIKDYAFMNCWDLTLVSEATTPPTMNNGLLYSQLKAIYIPVGCKDSYTAATGWNNWDSIIFEGSNKTLNVVNPGELSSLFSSGEKFTTVGLILTGNINGTDLLFIREMAGSDIKGVPTAGILQNLDLSGATIVEGGTYINLDDTYVDLGDDNKLYGFSAGPKTSVANTFEDYLFAGCQKLRSVKIPKSLERIGERVFAGSDLTSIQLYDNNDETRNLTTIDPFAFWYSKLVSIAIPKTVNNIGRKYWLDNPFAYINEYFRITLEAGNSRYSMSAGGKLLIDNTSHAIVCALGNEAIPDDITTIGSNAFCNRPELVNYTIPEGVTILTNPSYPNIGDNTFSQCANLESIVIPEGITVISSSAFRECPKLNSVTMPSSVERIEFNAFGNTGLTKITIPANVTYIASQAFAHNQNLETVISYITNPFNIDDDVFAKGWDLSTTTYPQTLKVPSGTKALYEAKAGWNKFTNIVEIPDHAILTATSYSRVYGEANPTFGFTDNGGLYSGTPSITCAATATSDVGTYDIVIAAGTITEPTAQYVNGTLTITKAPLKITAKSYTKKQGEANPEFAVTYEGFKNNETDAVLTTKPTVTCAATKDSPAGTYDITVSGAVAGNYEISYVAGTLTIEAAPTPMPEPKGTTFDVDTDDSSTKEVKVTFVVKESDGSSTPTVAISDDKDASGSVAIPEAVTHNGVEYKVTEISEGAFQNNTSLTEVKIPASITSIGAKAFAGCKNLQAITINIIVPINLAVISARGFTRTTGDDVFEGVDKETCILYVPEGSVDQYKSAPVWKEFKNILPIKTSTGIQGVVQTDGEPFDVFNLSGQKMKSNATSLEGLPRGIYIVKGKKVIN